MKGKLVIALVVLSSALALFSGCGPSQSGSEDEIEKAFASHASNIVVAGEGSVLRILPDDRSGLPHQRFILRLASGRTLLVEHNIDIAPRIDDLKVGDTVSFSGEYVWNDQ